MSGEPGTAAEELTFRDAAGEPVSVIAEVDAAESRVGEFLTARRVRFNGTELRQLRVAAASDRRAGYERLDNEILAGRRLNEVVGHDFGYPASVSRLRGDEAESAEPFALLEPYLGEPLQAVVGTMMDDEQREFETGLLTGLCWLEAAGIAHRGLTPSTVRWDSSRRQAQITDFSLCTVFGVPREAIGARDWVGPEQRSGGKVSGLVSNRDDMNSAAKLIYYVRCQGEPLKRPDLLAQVGLAYLEPLIAPPEKRPTARELFRLRQGRDSPVPRGLGGDGRLKEGHAVFDARRREKHPSIGREQPPPAARPAPHRGPGTPPQGGAGAAPPVPADSGKRHRWGLGRQS
jgi:serine/threonine protein kinase